MNTVHDTENEIIEQRRIKSENNNNDDDREEINNNNHSFYLTKCEDKRDKNDNEMHSKLPTTKQTTKKFSLNDDVVVMRTCSDKMKNHSTTTNNMENQANEQQILIDKSDKIRQHDELVDCEIRKSSSSLIEIGDEKEISVASVDSEILKIETNVSAVNNSNSITSSPPQISSDTSTSKATTTIPLQIGESLFSCIQLHFLLLFLARKSQVNFMYVMLKFTKKEKLCFRSL